MHRVKYLALLLLLVVVSARGVVHAQARTWAFSKDTVYEWAANKDSVTLTNNGTDTLKVDSVELELVHPTSSSFETMFYVKNNSYVIRGGQYPGFIGNNPKMMAIPQGQSLKAEGFSVESQVITVAKSSAIVQGDTLILRFIFIAAAGRGRDTLMLKGKQDFPVALHSVPDILQTPVFPNRFFDLRGRHIEKIPEGLMVPWAPFVRSKE